MAWAVSVEERAGPGLAFRTEDDVRDWDDTVDDDDPLYFLLAEYEERRDRGLDPDPEELCPDDPDLLKRLRDAIATMGRMDARLGLNQAADRASAFPSPEVPGIALEEEIGRGTMGVVYRGRQESLGRSVAVKVIRDGALAEKRDRRRFRIEARATARLDHPNIVVIHDHGEIDGLPYLVLEYLEGGSLADRIRGEPQSPRWAAVLMRTLASAVAEAHAQNILHRDLKPRNVVFTADGVPKITDFGLAKFLDEEQAYTFTWQALGTPSYMAPEQTGATNAAIGPQADVHALGAILYELLTGRPPFQSVSLLRTLELIRSRPPAPPRDARPQTPKDLQTICLKCLEKEPSRRYATARELADDLGRFLNGAPIEARPVGPWGHLRRWSRRQPGLAGLVAAGALFLILTALGALFVARSEHRARLAIEQAERRETSRAEGLAYVRRLDLASRAYSGNRIDQMKPLLDLCPPERRGWEWRCLERLRHADPLAFPAHDRRITSVAFSRDGDRLVTGSWDWTAKVWDARNGRELFTLSGHGAKVTDVAFSPDGSWIATASQDRTVKLWDAKSGRTIQTLRGHPGKLYGLDFSPDGSRIVAVGVPGGGILWDARTGEELMRLDADASEEFYLVAFRPDGARIAATGEPGVARVWDAATGRPLAGQRRPTMKFAHGVAFDPAGAALAFLGDEHAATTLLALEPGREPILLAGHSDAVTDVELHPNGERLATSGRDKTVRIWDARTGEELLTLQGHSWAVMGLAWSFDGDRLASVGEDGTVLIWDAAAPPSGESPGRALRTLESRRDAAIDVAFSPDGSRIAAAGDDGLLTIRDASTGGELASLTLDVREILRVRFSLDGSRIASADVDGGVSLWNAETGAPVPSPAGHGGPVYDLAFQPGGGALATAGGDQTIRLWNVDDGRSILTIDVPDEVLSLAFHPDGSRLASSQGADVTIREAATGRVLQTLQGHAGEVWAVAFSPDGSRLASAGADETVRVWDLSTGKLVHILAGHFGTVCRVAFSPDGARLASTGRDRMVKIWDVASGRDVHTLRGHRNRVRGLAYSPDGSRIATAGDDGAVMLWKSSPGP